MASLGHFAAMALLLLAQSTNFCKEAWMNIRMFSMWPDGSFKT